MGKLSKLALLLAAAIVASAAESAAGQAVERADDQDRSLRGRSLGVCDTACTFGSGRCKFGNGFCMRKIWGRCIGGSRYCAPASTSSPTPSRTPTETPTPTVTPTASATPGYIAPIAGMDVGDDSECVAWSHHDNLVAAGRADGKFRLWDVSDPTSPVHKKTKSAHNSGKAIRAIAFANSMSRMATVGADKRVKLWNVNNPGNPSKVFQAYIGSARIPWSVAFSPDDSRILVGTHDGRVVAYDLSGNKKWEESNVHSQTVRTIAYSPDGAQLVTGSHNKKMARWDVGNNGLNNPADKGMGGYVYDASWAPASKGAYVAVAAGPGSFIMDLSNTGAAPTQVAQLDTSLQYGVAWSTEGNTLASAGKNGDVDLWDVRDMANPSKYATLDDHGEDVTGIAWSTANHRFASVSESGMVLIWDTQHEEHHF